MNDGDFVQHLLSQIDLRDKEITLYQDINTELNKKIAELKNTIFYMKYNEEQRIWEQFGQSSKRDGKKPVPPKKNRERFRKMSLEAPIPLPGQEYYLNQPINPGGTLPHDFTAHCPPKDKEPAAQQGSSSGSN